MKQKDCFFENKGVMTSFKAGVLHLLMHILNLDGIIHVVTPVNNMQILVGLSHVKFANQNTAQKCYLISRY